MCPPEYFAVAVRDQPVDGHHRAGRRRAGRQAVGAAAGDAGRPRPHGARAARPSRACRTWSTRPTARSRSTASRYGARFRYPQRTAEAAAHRAFYERAGLAVRRADRDATRARATSPTCPRRTAALILAGYGFRTEPAAHAAGAGGARPPGGLAASGRPALLPPRHRAGRARRPATSPTTRAPSRPPPSGCSRQLFPDAVLADEPDALAFGLNLVSDGRHVVLNAEATGLASKVRGGRLHARCRSSLTELKKGGGSVKCCVAELRH